MPVTRHVRNGSKRSRHRPRPRCSNDAATTKHVEHAAKPKHYDVANHVECHDIVDYVRHSKTDWNGASATARENQPNAAGPSLRLAKGETQSSPLAKSKRYGKSERYGNGYSYCNGDSDWNAVSEKSKIGN